MRDPGNKWFVVVGAVFLLASCDQDAATLAKWASNALEGNRIAEAERYIARLKAKEPQSARTHAAVAELMRQKGDFAAAAKGNTKWIALAGLFDAVSLLFQLASYAYIPVVITVSIKRAGIVLSVFAGWLFFREREITDQLIAASVMFCGVLILYLKVTPVAAFVMVAATLAGMSIALYATRSATRSATQEKKA